MSHEIDMTTGRPAMAYVGAPPWHKLGQSMQPDAPREEWHGVLPFELNTSRMFYQNSKGEFVAYDKAHGADTDRVVILRNDTDKAIAVATDMYNLVQPRQVVDFCYDACEDLGFTMETVGSLKGGAIYWALAKTKQGKWSAGRLTGGGGIVGDRDDHEAYVTIFTSADGSFRTRAMFTGVRIVCWNTLSWADRAKGGVTVSHRSKFDADEVKRALGLVDFEAEWAKYRKQMEALKSIPVNAEQARTFFYDLLRDPAKSKAKQEAQAERAAAVAADPKALLTGAASIGEYKATVATVEREPRGMAGMLESYTSAPGSGGSSSHPTAYDLVNGVTHFLDHKRGKDADKRLHSSWFAQGRTMKARAVTSALALGEQKTTTA